MPRSRSYSPPPSPPSKRTRRASPSPPAPRSLLDLPVELLSDIVNRLRRRDLKQLSQTCKALYNAYRKHVILKYFAEDEYWNGRWTGTDHGLQINLWCLSDAEEGDSQGEEYQPAAEIFATAVVPEVERYEEEELASSYLFVTHTNGYEFLDDMREGRSEWIDWDGDVRGRLVKATPEILRKRFTCPECKGCEEVETTRLGRLLDLPCPRCTWTEEVVARGKMVVDEEIEKEILEEIEREALEEMGGYY